MRALLLNQYYHPDLAPTAQLLTDLGGALAARGHQVTAIAGNRPYAAGRALPLRDEHEGVTIVRVPATAFGRGAPLLRLLDYGSFYAGAAARLAGARPDVVVALSTPPLLSTLGLLPRALGRSRLVLWVMDVYPQLAVALGLLRERAALTRALEAAARVMLGRADAIVALDEAMRDRLVAAGADPARVEVIDNWCDGDAIVPWHRSRPSPGDNPLRRELGLEREFVVSYSGNMGLGHDFDTLLAAMARLRDQAVHWLLIGDGPRRGQLAERARALGVTRVTFLPYRPRAELPVSLTAADASLVLLGAGLDGLLVPSKLYSALAAGLPVLYVGPPAGRAFTVTAEGAGLWAANGDGDTLAANVLRLRDEPALRAALGARGRALLDARFRRDLALERHHALLLRVVGAPC